MLYFSIASILIVIDGLYAWLLQAIGLLGAKITSFTAILVALVNTGFNFILIPKFGITGAINSLVLSYVISIMMKLGLGRNYLKKGTDQQI